MYSLLALAALILAGLGIKWLMPGSSVKDTSALAAQAKALADQIAKSKEDLNAPLKPLTPSETESFWNKK
jgi:hypothetical protein